jgi:hypothetical protein
MEGIRCVLLDIGMCIHVWIRPPQSHGYPWKVQDRVFLHLTLAALCFVQMFFLFENVLKLTLVLSCRGYDLPNLIREGNTGRSSQPVTPAFHLTQSSAIRSRTKKRRLSVRSIIFSSLTLSPHCPTSSPPNGTRTNLFPTAMPFPPNIALRQRLLKRTSAISRLAT